jgi:DNA-binding NarL/FixJ family response regulator
VNNSQPNNVYASEPASRSGEARRILLLEDSPGEAELSYEALVLAWKKLEPDPEAPRPGIDVQHTAKDALVCLRNPAWQKTHNLPDLVVLDLDLPGGTSLMFLRELRMDSRLATLPVIVMAWSDEQNIVRSLDGLGVVGYVVEPMLLDDLVALVGGFCRHVLSGNSRQEFCALDWMRPA